MSGKNSTILQCEQNIKPFPEDEILEIIAIQPILPTKNNRQQMFGERTETEAMHENRIKELKANFGAESLTLKAFSYRSCTYIFR